MSGKVSSAAFEAWRKEQMDSLIRMGYPDAARAFKQLGSVQWAGWMAAWNASRAAIEVDLPIEDNTRCYTVAEEAKQEAYNQGLGECRYAIESAGLKVKP